MRFVADVMVGKLARWLRILGFDVLYSNKYEDDAILQIARRDHRIILTRDANLARRAGERGSLLIEGGACDEQLRQVVTTFNLGNFNVFSRCLQCNTVLNDVDKEAVFTKVPPYVYLTQERFAQCPNCTRIYWHGTHADEMRQRATRWLASAGQGKDAMD